MKKLITVSLAIVLVAVALFVINTDFADAYMRKQTEQVQNTFVPALVSCEVHEVVSGNIKNDITVQNTGNIDTYIRLRLVSYWIDADGQIVFKTSSVPKITDVDTTNWIADIKNDTYYYKHKVSPNGNTSDLLSKQTISLTSEDGTRQVVEIIAESIQANPVTAVSESWGVVVTDGIITSK